MAVKAAYRHTNINAKDWRRLSAFYQEVFGCVPVPPERDLSGDWFERVTGVKGAAVQGEHIALPGYGDDGPTFEIFTYSVPEGTRPLAINGYGFAHVAFEVDDVEEAYQAVRKAGGSACGELLRHYYPSKDMTLTIVYAKDPEGNVVELMKWTDGRCMDESSSQV
ncbi:VOC family protein [Bacilliculturomica massiliensis]|uniref:VOC family protein n=1 Tax=Bacilliculturomica massiliensis TaxID=1917867 RepID=UPI00103112C1|nr:VOC family protein [Bacilliculturomica massiliensis]